MMHLNPRTRPLRALAWGVALLLAAELALAGEQGWSLRFNGFWVDPDLRLDRVDAEGDRVRADADTGAGAGINGEYRFSPRLGLELGAMGGAESDIRVRVTEPGGSVALTDALAFSVLSAGLNVHLMPKRRVDLYAGPLLAYVHYSDLSLEAGSFQPGFPFNGFTPVSVVIRTDDDVAVGANLGVDVPIRTGRWLFNADLRFLKTRLDTRGPDGDRDEVDFDPLMLGLGFGYRF